MSRWIAVGFIVTFLSGLFVAWELFHRPLIDPEVGLADWNTAKEKSGAAEADFESQTTNSDIPKVRGDEVQLAENSLLWRRVDDIPVGAPSVREDVPSTRLVEFDAVLLESLKSGMSVRLDIPDLDEPIEVFIQTVKTLPSGNTSIHGKVNDSHWLDFIATVSDKSTNATIGTEQGVFNLRGNRTMAWIAPGRAFNHLVDPSIPDFRLPSYLRSKETGS